MLDSRHLECASPDVTFLACRESARDARIITALSWQQFISGMRDETEDNPYQGV